MSQVRLDAYTFTSRVSNSLALQIQLRAEDLYDKDKVDLETIVVDDVFKLLQCTEAGLDGAEAARRLELFGPNRLESEEQNPFLQVCFLRACRVVDLLLIFICAVPWFHVEPSIMGYGGCRSCRYRRF